ncbi:hypothetical protein TorRG33x02_146680 [Trema orientale]|uniref:Uncharacterized protein n=1 Tax=Trema orientale TaxID=63057 RepID=A0A2P5EVF7_TREOI|nr:hypothetical protein TorRG33x02_146680 [Trema orientale]
MVHPQHDELSDKLVSAKRLLGNANNSTPLVLFPSPVTDSEGRHGLSFSSLEAKLSKNLRSIMAKTSGNSKNKSLSSSWETSSVLDCSFECVGFRQAGFDLDGSDIQKPSNRCCDRKPHTHSHH